MHAEPAPPTEGSNGSYRSLPINWAPETTFAVSRADRCPPPPLTAVQRQAGQVSASLAPACAGHMPVTMQTRRRQSTGRVHPTGQAGSCFQQPACSARLSSRAHLSTPKLYTQAHKVPPACLHRSTAQAQLMRSASTCTPRFFTGQTWPPTLPAGTAHKRVSSEWREKEISYR